MSAVYIAAVQRNDLQKFAEEKIKRRSLRDISNPLDIPYSMCINCYRLNKSAFIMLLDTVEPHLKKSSILSIVKLAAVLRFLAEGSFQRSVGRDSDIALGRSTVSKVLTEMINILEKKICPVWIKFGMSEEEKRKSKRHFMDNFNIPGVVGCVDSSHVRILQPHQDSSLFYNRKGYFSINVMIICDYNLIIKAVDARRPGSSHDSIIWNMSKARNHLKSRYDSGDHGSWLLGDAGYGLEPFLLTPYRNPAAGTSKHAFNQKQSKARNAVERTIGVLKNRFICIKDRTLNYQPRKAIQIINVCCALHNICRHYKVQYEEDNNFEPDETDEIDEIDEDLIIAENAATNTHAIQIRDNIANAINLVIS